MHISLVGTSLCILFSTSCIYIKYISNVSVYVNELIFSSVNSVLRYPRKNNYRCRLRRRHSDTGKYTQPSQTLLYSLERAATDVGLHVNAHKTGDISTLDGTSLKLVDKFTYLGSSISSTEKDIDTRLTKAWTAIDKLSIIWKSD